MRAALAGLGVFAACVAAPAAALAQEGVYDPFEGANRHLFGAHEAVDHAVLAPLARGYRAIAPEPVRKGVTNALRNLRAPVIFVNDVLQGEIGRAGTTFARFGVNSTIGVLGLMDPAQGMGLERHDEDFGQTLAVWGVAEGPYIFMPILGPTNLRDGAGQIVDLAFDPLRLAQFDGDDTFRATRGALTGISARESLLETVDEVRANSLDPYVTYRSTYGLLRDSAIQNGRRDVQDLPEFDAIPESEREGSETNPADEPQEQPAASAAPKE